MTSILQTVCLKDLSPILSCIHNNTTDSKIITENARKDSFKYFKKLRLKNEDGFSLIISLQDGTTVHVTSSVKTILGYTENDLLGECIMKFLYPPDCIAFAEHLTRGLNRCYMENENGNGKQASYSFYCRIREKNDGKYEENGNYMPFQITANIERVEKNDNACLIASVVPVHSAYKVPGEIPAMTFSTRHSVSCHFSHVDKSAVPYLGFLPQDMIGYSIFDFYHVDDMPQLKDIYELVVKEQGYSFRSKPYRFRVFNGCYITIETEWSCFINPWSHKIEFVVGQHRVLKGPEVIDVFKRENKEHTVADEILKESQQIQEEIKNLLSKSVKTFRLSKHHTDKWKRDLTSKINCLIDDVQKGTNEENDLAEDEGCSCSDQGSVLLGEISPHQEFNNSDPSSETPPSFQELRYKENIERFFASHPKTYSSDGSGGSKCEDRQIPNLSTDEENGKTPGEKEKNFVYCKKSSARYECRIKASSCGSSNWKMSSVQTADSGNASLETKDGMQPVDTSSGSSSRESGGSSCDNYPPCPTLTEQILSQHNRMTHKHLKQRKIISSGGLSRKERDRLKRSGSPQSCERLTGAHKHIKLNRNQIINTVTVPTQTDVSVPLSSYNVSSPFSFPGFPNIAQPQSSHSITINSSSSSPAYQTSMTNFAIPVYGYIPTSNSSATPIFMPVMYMGAVPFCPSISTMIPQSEHWQYNAKIPDQSNSVNSEMHQSNNNNFQTCNTGPSKQKADSFENIPAIPVIEPNDAANEVITQKSTVHSTCDKNLIAQMQSSNNELEGKELVNGKIEEDLNQKSHGENEHDKDPDDTTLSFTSTLLKSDDLSSHSQFDQAEDMELDLKDDACKSPNVVQQDPPWMAGVKMDSNTVFHYQIRPVDLDEVLKKDLEMLQSAQPKLVNEQLECLQSDLEDEMNYNCNVLGFTTTEDDMNEDLERKEENMLQMITGE